MKKDTKFSATVVSDIHVDIKNPTLWLLKFIITRSLKITEKDKMDAYITVGDNTSNGNKTNWDIACNFFNKANIKAPIILTIGNHDCWSNESEEEGEAEYNCGIQRYFEGVERITGRRLKKPYFSTVINGYRMISLGNEADSGCEAIISDEQLDWLRNELKEATKDSKPAFVFCHQSLNARHGLPRTWDKKEDPNRNINEGGVGEKSEEIADILKSFKNVFYFSGHSHMGLCGEEMMKKEGYSSFQCEDGLHLINLPTLTCGNHHGETNKLGYGVEIRVYDDTVKIIPRNYISGRYNKKIKIKDKKPYYEVKLG